MTPTLFYVRQYPKNNHALEASLEYGGPAAHPDRLKSIDIAVPRSQVSFEDLTQWFGTPVRSNKARDFSAFLNAWHQVAARLK